MRSNMLAVWTCSALQQHAEMLMADVISRQPSTAERLYAEAMLHEATERLRGGNLSESSLRSLYAVVYAAGAILKET